AYQYNTNPTGGDVTNAPACPSGQNIDQTIFSDNMEAGLGNWNLTAGGGRWSNTWAYPAVGVNAHSGTKVLYADDYPPTISNTSAAMQNSYNIPANAYLRFYHHDWFDWPFYDGGIVEYSTNNGASWSDLKNLIDFGGYNSTIAPNTLGDPGNY